MRGNTVRKLVLLGAPAALAGAALLAGISPASAAPTRPATVAKPDLSYTPKMPKVGDVVNGHKVLRVVMADDSKATNIKYGKVTINGTTLTAITSKDCPALNASPLMNPLGYADNQIFLVMSWHAQLTPAGHPLARMRTGNSSFVESNHTDTYAFYWADGIWFDYQYANNRGSNWWGWAHAPSLDRLGPFYMKYGTRNKVGIAVATNGNANSPWTNPPGGLGGSRLLQLIPNYYPSTPTFSIQLTDAANTSLHEETMFQFNVGRDQSGNVTCGGIGVLDF
jgi:hypothetical protein